MYHLSRKLQSREQNISSIMENKYNVLYIFFLVINLDILHLDILHLLFSGTNKSFEICSKCGSSNV